ncbi:alpha-L-fucosidase [Pedobacter sp. MC2016-05]|uniref:alpha-L-fucosidase n=1 Tax=Pedobacter sp. MC2016-05 TaxID=2994474 RepID=UPI0022455F82|nr:alpha-L-fucosidase [Pedobacter sp. MC2016-05]
MFTFALITQAQAPKPYGPIPNKAQLNWHEMEMYSIIHFGVDTYTDKEWGFGDESPELINPKKFDAAQIVGALKAGGFKGIVVVAKHHDGLCLWPTKTTSHSISASKWMNGKGDMIKDYQNACNKLNMQLGLYCSPWDRNNALYGQPGYLDIYRNQLKELLTNYGPVFVSWHDGANGGNGYYGGANEERKIDRSIYYQWPQTWEMIRKWQPQIAIFGDVGPDIRWVGNEEGHAGETCWATYTPEAPEPGKVASNGFSQYWKSTQGTKNGKYWMPAECDVPMRPGWFYHANQNEKLKTASDLVALYYQSVGRGANLNLGVSPNPDGLLERRDVEELKKFGEIINLTFKANILAGAQLRAKNIRQGNSKKFGLQFLTDQDRYSYWATDDDVHTAQLTATLPQEKTFNVIQLRENIKLGQRIRAFSVDIFDQGVWKEIAKGTSIGSNRLIRLPKKLKVSRVRLNINQADACIALSHFGLYSEPLRPETPKILRNQNGIVTIVEQPGSTVYYTVNGDSPSSASKVYSRAFDFKNGGKIRAIAIDRWNNISDVTYIELGISKIQWSLSSNVKPTKGFAADAIDDNLNTRLEFDKLPDDALPIELTVDMGKTNTIKAFTFYSGKPDVNESIIDKYGIAVSEDGVNWRKLPDGEFSNIRANPVEQIIRAKEILSARYFRFTIRHLNGSGRFSIVELGIR